SLVKLMMASATAKAVARRKNNFTYLVDLSPPDKSTPMARAFAVQSSGLSGENRLKLANQSGNILKLTKGSLLSNLCLKQANLTNKPSLSTRPLSNLGRSAAF